jgi:hypothetical protein
MTVTTLTVLPYILPIVELAISDRKEDVVERNNLLEDFLLSKFEEMKELPESFNINDLATLCFGNQYQAHYLRVREFIFRTNEDLKIGNKDVLSTGLALIFEEGLELKEACKKVHKHYRSGGAYLFSRKFLFMLLLTKSVDFRMFIRDILDEEGEQVYDVPHNLEEKYNRITDAMLAA